MHSNVVLRITTNGPDHKWVMHEISEIFATVHVVDIQKHVARVQHTQIAYFPDMFWWVYKMKRQGLQALDRRASMASGEDQEMVGAPGAHETA